MAGPFAAVVGGFATAWIAITHTDPLVADNYYKEGLAINRDLDRDRMADQRGYHADVMVSEDGARVRVYLAGGAALPDTIRLRFVHPTRADRDRSVELNGREGGWYEGPLDLPAGPRWRIDLEDELRTWRIGGDWRPAEGPAKLQPRG
jgi:hypothetical protein